MEDQTQTGFQRRCGWKAVIVGAGALTLMACSGPAWQRGSAVKPDERSLAEYCVMDRRADDSGRVINYVDPELCQRFVVARSPYTVRVPPLIRPASAGQRGR